MATKKYLSYDGLTEYDALIKAKIDESAENVKNDLLNGAAEDILASKNETLASAQAYTDQQIAAIANAEMIEDQINNLNQAITDKADKNYETWMFTLADGTVIEKRVLINA